MFDFFIALVVVGAVCYGAIRGMKQQIARTKEMKREKANSEFELLIANCMHKHNIAQREAEKIVIAEGHLPPDGWVSYIPKT